MFGGPADPLGSPPGPESTNRGRELSLPAIPNNLRNDKNRRTTNKNA